MSPFFVGVITFLLGLLVMVILLHNKAIIFPLEKLETLVHKALPWVNPDSYLRIVLTFVLFFLLTLACLVGLHKVLNPSLDLLMFCLLAYLGAGTAIWLKIHVK